MSFPIIYGLPSQRAVAFSTVRADAAVKESSTSQPVVAPPKDCMGCRVTGGSVLGAVTVYIGYNLYRTPKAETGNRVALGCLAAVTGSLAIYRVLGL